MTKNNKAMRLQLFLTHNPEVATRVAARRLGVSKSYAQLIRKRMTSALEAPAEPLTSEQVKVSEEALAEVVYQFSRGRQARQADANNVDEILNKRAATYGNFIDVARIAQRLKHVAHTAAGERDRTFAADQAEAMDMIFSKLARIINGDANHIDSWLDIAGYAKLVSDRLEALARGLPKQE
jgi:hypothetical protein